MRDRKIGLTLIEIAMVIVVVGALSGGVIIFVTQGVDLWNFITFRNEESSQGRLAMDRIVREARQIKDTSSLDTAGSADLKFSDINNNSIEFSLSGANLMRNSDILADGVSSLQFQYYDAQNNLLSIPKVLPDVTDIHRINITFTVTSGDQSTTFKSQVFPRNF